VEAPPRELEAFVRKGSEIWVREDRGIVQLRGASGAEVEPLGGEAAGPEPSSPLDEWWRWVRERLPRLGPNATGVRLRIQVEDTSTSWGLLRDLVVPFAERAPESSLVEMRMGADPAWTSLGRPVHSAAVEPPTEFVSHAPPVLGLHVYADEVGGLRALLTGSVRSADGDPQVLLVDAIAAVAAFVRRHPSAEKWCRLVVYPGKFGAGGSHLRAVHLQAVLRALSDGCSDCVRLAWVLPLGGGVTALW
jgi:hypothetical protein